MSVDTVSVLIINRTHYFVSDPNRPTSQV